MVNRSILVSSNEESHTSPSFPARKSGIKRGDERLRQPEGEDELGARHEQLGDEALEEGAGALVLGHVGQDAEAALGVVEVAVLDAGLDHVEGGGDDEGGGGAGDGGDEVLEPGGFVVVLEGEEEFFCEGGAAEELWGVRLGENGKGEGGDVNVRRMNRGHF